MKHVNKILTDLRNERRQVEKAVIALERLAARGRPPKRGGPPKVSRAAAYIRLNARLADAVSKIARPGSRFADQLR
jgi:hypothetical protein